MKLLRFSFLALGLMACLGRLAAAAPHDPSDYGQLAGTVIVPEKLPVADVQQAILLAATGRGWAVKDRADGRVVIFLEQRGWRSTLTLLYSSAEVTLYSDSGKVDKTGQIKKREIPEGWVKYLKQDLTKQLGIKAYAK